MSTAGGPTLLLPVDTQPVEGPRAEEMRRWGADPALGRALVDGLSDDFRVVAFDYEGQVLRVPKPDTLTPDNVVRDLLAVADAAGAARFGYYGCSWLAMAGLQLAIRTDRLAAPAMGGFPPLDGPYAQMLRISEATHAVASAAVTGVARCDSAGLRMIIGASDLPNPALSRLGRAGVPPTQADPASTF